MQDAVPRGKSEIERPFNSVTKYSISSVALYLGAVRFSFALFSILALIQVISVKVPRGSGVLIMLINQGHRDCPWVGHWEARLGSEFGLR